MGNFKELRQAVRDNTLKPFCRICGKTTHLKHPEVQGAVVGMEHGKGDWTFTRISTLIRVARICISEGELRTMWELISGRADKRRQAKRFTALQVGARQL